MDIYILRFENQSVALSAGDHDLFYLAPATNRPLRVTALEFDVVSELGDAQEEVLRLQWVRGHTSASTGGASQTPENVGLNGGSAGGTFRVADTAIATGGTPDLSLPFGVNVRIAPNLWVPPYPIPVSAAETSLVLRLMAAVADDINLNATLWFEQD
jgi:hypothetical protein